MQKCFQGGGGGGDKFGVWIKEVGGWAGGGSLCEVLYPTLTKGGGRE